MVIKEWILNIVSICLIGVVLDIVMPNGNLKKYSRFIIGLVTVVAILSPILNLFDQLPQLEKSIASNVFDMDMKSFEHQSKVVSETHQDQVEKLFRENLENHVTQEVQKLTGNSNVRAQVEVADTNIKQMGKIDKLYIEIGRREEGVKSIEPIGIYIDTSEDKKQGQELISDIDNAEQSRIKEHISDIYGIEPSKIYISLIDEFN